MIYDIKAKWIEDSKVRTFCKCCARESVFEERSHYGQTNVKSIGGTENWYLLQCVVCLQIQLIKYSYRMVPGRYGAEPVDDSMTLLYPTEGDSLSGLPDIISKEYQAALKVRDVSLNACAVLVRRTLEVICKHENAEGKTLMGKIENLIQSNRIPPLLADMAHLGRKIGNLGAHVTDDEVTDDDVAALLDFVEAILEYLYIAPQKIAALKARLDKTS